VEITLASTLLAKRAVALLHVGNTVAAPIVIKGLEDDPNAALPV
jgi:hypothetical protein